MAFISPGEGTAIYSREISVAFYLFIPLPRLSASFPPTSLIPALGALLQ